LGVALGAFLTRRSELLRLRVERRTQIFDEACGLTAQYSLHISSLGPNHSAILDDRFLASVMALDFKIKTHFPSRAYGTWRAAESMIAHKPIHSASDFSHARKIALASLGKELR
jgi:hypothetical protein